MARGHAEVIGRALAAVLIVILGLSESGCALLHGPGRLPLRISAPSNRPSILTFVLDATSAGTLATLNTIASRSARADEQLVVIRSRHDQILASCAAPAPPSALVPGHPILAPDATSFQVASYHRALAAYRARLRSATAELKRRQRVELAAWVGRCVDLAVAANRRRGAPTGRYPTATAIEDAASNAATMEQTGLRTGTRRVIVVLGFRDSPRTLASLHPDLQGDTVVVAGYPVGDDGTALQARLLEAGADDAVVLTPASDDRLVPVVDDGLGGTITVTLANLNYGVAQYRLPRTAMPQLVQVLRLLTITYPDATATINGYTDSIPVRGGNVRLSWERANVVLRWLTQHGVWASRLLAVGHGANYPIAPNLAKGQPRNRRVVIVIEPDMPTQS